MSLKFPACIFASSLLFSAAAHADPVRANTESGIVVGVREAGVETFKGIPFATAPVGDMRWRPPVAASKWTVERDATKPGAACPQDPRAAGNPKPQSEDCLFLNVWTPRSHTAQPAPVMVYIHGGGNIGGAGSQEVYDGAAFARDGVVAVTFNYRLGALGFFAHPALWKDSASSKVSGNFALMDQIAALEWVQRNISKFGGDPRRVTLAGQSAGGEAVLNLMSTPKAKGLFQRAIAASAPGWKTPRPLEVAQADDVNLMEAVGQARDVSITQLRQLAPEKFFAFPRDVGPYIDGDLVRAPPLESFAAGHDRRVPLLIGSVSDEGVLLAAYPDGIPMIQRQLGNRQGAIRDLYRPLAKDDKAFERQLFGDVVFGAPLRRLAALHSKRAPTYLYRFDYVITRDRQKAPGAWHTSDILFAFDNVATWWPSSSDEDHAMGKLVHACWVSFVKTGAPVCPTTKPWSAYRPSSDETMVFAPGGSRSQSGLRRAQYDALMSAIGPSPSQRK